jgi:DNA N-6-adenine-methyltransferase (Dam)/Protein of unknown function (DUF3102)
VLESISHLIEAGKRLLAKKAAMSHGQWTQWLEDNQPTLGFGNDRTARKLMTIAKTAVTADMTIESCKKAIRTAWGNDPRGTQGTGDNEWHTPAQYVELARKVLGTIDLDPASSDAAQRVVRAKEYLTKKDNGLVGEWWGKVWLNPPYAQPLIAEFTKKLILETCLGRVKEAIALTHNYTDTVWFHDMAQYASAICFTRGRVAFVKADGEIAAPMHGQAFFYFGDDVEKFADVFADVGFVVGRIECSDH